MEWKDVEVGAQCAEHGKLSWRHVGSVAQSSAMLHQRLHVFRTLGKIRWYLEDNQYVLGFEG